MNQNSMPLLETRDLKKYFKVGSNAILHAVDGISFKLEAGKTLASWANPAVEKPRSAEPSFS